jgi:hypothetical protein
LSLDRCANLIANVQGRHLRVICSFAAAATAALFDCAAARRHTHHGNASHPQPRTHAARG